MPLFTQPHLLTGFCSVPSPVPPMMVYFQPRICSNLFNTLKNVFPTLVCPTCYWPLYSTLQERSASFPLLCHQRQGPRDGFRGWSLWHGTGKYSDEGNNHQHQYHLCFATSNSEQTTTLDWSTTLTLFPAVVILKLTSPGFLFFRLVFTGHSSLPNLIQIYFGWMR